MGHAVEVLFVEVGDHGQVDVLGFQLGLDLIVHDVADAGIDHWFLRLSVCNDYRLIVHANPALVNCLPVLDFNRILQ